MERIEDLVTSGAHVKAGDTYVPALPLPMYGLVPALKDAWAVLWGRATAVQWPEHRK